MKFQNLKWMFNIKIQHKLMFKNKYWTKLISQNINYSESELHKISQYT